MRLARFAPAMAFLVASLAAAGPAVAQLPGHSPYKESQSVWSTMDKCRRQGFQKFPDYTPESNAKRERAVQQCLEAYGLPTPQQPPPQSAGDGGGAASR